ncbi:MAG: hypothetical protein R2751_19360 [Bacteroidales bacterium]
MDVHWVDLDDYVLLPTLEEVFINLVHEVDVLHRRGGTRLKIRSESADLQVYQPLILLDNIPVFDVEALMQISPEKVRRIDVINRVYVKGALFFGGIVSIQSRKGDLAGIDLASGSYFFDFLSYQAPVAEIDPGRAGDRERPDLRNTLFWNGRVILDRAEATRLEVPLPRRNGTFQIVVRGRDDGGNPWIVCRSFRVGDGEIDIFGPHDGSGTPPSSSGIL